MEKRVLHVKSSIVIETCLFLGFDENYEKLTSTEKGIVTALIFIASRYDANIVRILFRKFKDVLLENLDKADVKLGIADGKWATIFINGVPQKWYDIVETKFIDEVPIVIDARLFDVKGIANIIELRPTAMPDTNSRFKTGQIL